MIIINVLNPVYGKTNNNDIIINNNNNDKLIHVQYKIEKGSIVVPLASSTLPCLNSNKTNNNSCQFPLQTLNYKVAIINVFFDMDNIEYIKTNINKNDNKELNRLIMKKIITSQNLIGATRLQCNDKLYESYIDMISNEEEEKEEILLKKDVSYDYDEMFYKLSKIIIPTKIASSKKSIQVKPFTKHLEPFYDLFINKKSSRKFYYNSHNEQLKQKKRKMQHLFQSLLLLSYTDSDGKLIHLIPEKNIRNCKLHILSKPEQTLRPPKTTKIFGTSLAGKYGLESVLKIVNRQNDDRQDDVEMKKQMTNLHGFYEKLLPPSSIITIINMRKKEDQTLTRFLQINDEPAEEEEEEESSGPPEDPPNGYEEVQGILDQVRAIVDPTFEDILLPLKDAFIQWLADRSKEELHATMPNEAGSTIEDSVTRETQPALDVSITMNIGPALADTLPDIIDAAVSDTAGNIAAEQIAAVTVPPLSDMLSLSTVSAIATQATDYVGNKIARITSHQLGLTLGKSIPNAAVPAIVHTITHSPLQDYFCYYCYAHKAYCQYCNYAPSQLYYAQYYANFYSSYYPLYYADYHGSASGTKRKRRAGPTDMFV